MLVSEISTRVLRQFGDEANVQITDADILRWVNDAMREIALHNNLLQSRATTRLIAGQREYGLPNDVLTLRSVRYADTKLRAMAPAEAEAYIERPHDTTNRGVPQLYWVWANRLNIWPTPDRTDANDLQIFYTRQPIPVAAVTETPELPLQYHNRIVEYCLQQAYELDENWSAAQAKQQQFQQGVEVLKGQEEYTPRDFYPSIVSLPEDY